MTSPIFLALLFSGSAPSPSQLSTQLPLANICLFLCNSATSLIAVLSTVRFYHVNEALILFIVLGGNVITPL